MPWSLAHVSNISLCSGLHTKELDIALISQVSTVSVIPKVLSQFTTLFKRTICAAYELIHDIFYVDNIIHEVPWRCLNLCRNVSASMHVTLAGQRRAIKLATLNGRQSEDYIKPGKSKQVLRKSNIPLEPLNTLRVFRERNKNYSLPIPSSARYPTGEYNRTWEPKIPNGTVVVNACFDSLYSTTINDPPDVAKIQAVTAPTPADATTLSFPLSSGHCLDHVNVNFTEVAELEINETRQFDFYVNGEQMLTLNPEYRTCSGAWANSQSEGTCIVELCPTEDSTLPPIISAIEVYTSSDSLWIDYESLQAALSSQRDGVEILVTQVLLFGNGRLAANKKLEQGKSREQSRALNNQGINAAALGNHIFSAFVRALQLRNAEATSPDLIFKHLGCFQYNEIP
ncbi:Malectin-like domain [Dillenia turbinata]|uniref:Malectin-like domain n=1 Tax=Dillenia turbinata TaxID=194707 RepID=A0AAN8WE55_9MAGN